MRGDVEEILEGGVDGVYMSESASSEEVDSLSLSEHRALEDNTDLLPATDEAELPEGPGFDKRDESFA